MYFPNWSRTNLASVCPSPTTCLAQLWVGWARFFCCNPHLCKALNSVFLGHLLALWQVTCQVGRSSCFFSFLAPAHLCLMVPVVQGGVLGFLPGRGMTSLTSRCWCFSFLLQLITPNTSDPGHLSSSDWYHLPSSVYSWPVVCLLLASLPLAYLAPPPVLISPVTPDCTDSGHTLDLNLCLISEVGLLSAAGTEATFLSNQLPCWLPNPPEPQTIVLYHSGTNSVSIQGKEEQQVKYLEK